jgi:hypothetical protein
MRFEPVGRMAAPIVPLLLLFTAEGSSPTAANTSTQQARAAVLVDFRALDANGQPVTDMKPADLILRVSGRERRVSSLELITRADTAPDPVVAPPFATNVAAQSAPRDVAVLIDEASIAPGREPLLRETVTSFLSRLSRRDRVRLISLRPNGPVLPFEEGLRDMNAALARFAGHSTRTETENDLVCRSQIGLEMMQSLFANYAGNPLPTFVIVSGGFGSPPTGGVTSFGNYGKCPVLQTIDFENAGAAARAINASVYVVHLTDVTASPLPRQSLELGVETLAGALGAEVIRAAEPSAASMARIATATSAYYLAGFEPEANDRAGVPLRIDLRSRRADVTIRARSEIPGPPKGTAAGATPTPDAMIRVATSYRDLHLRAAGFASRAESDDKVRLVVLFEPEDPATKVTAASIGLYDAKGRLTRWTAESADLASRPIVAGILVPPGTYRMRVAASSGATAGTVDTEVRAELADAGAITTSALLLGVSGPNGFLPRMQFSGSDAGAFGYVELYRVPKNAVVEVSLELAANADGPALAEHDVPLTPGPRDDVRIAFSGFAIDAMPPGDLVMRATISLNGKPVGRAVRTLRKVK